MLGHSFELFIIILVGLLIFGPKKVIEMGAAAGRLLRDLRAAFREMGWPGFPSAGTFQQSPLSHLSQLAQSLTADTTTATPAAPTPEPSVDQASPTAPTTPSAPTATPESPSA
ncbi:MAG: hypothetical protein OJF49_001421 [Ktedonobacterales bacterium]|jgi:hypothetical protein|nr:MAG: hypothetical protein OJF49_001421 [Ktedonobacterales bacterium]